MQRPHGAVLGLGILAVLALAAYTLRIQHEMVDFAVYYRTAERALHAEPLYQAADGHYQFKYLPFFALTVAPLALLGISTAKALWFATSIVLLVVFVRGSVRALPDRRRSARSLSWLTLLFMAKFYAHELTLGQTNILLGTLLLAGLLALNAGSPRRAGMLIGLAVFVKPYAAILLPWLGAVSGVGAALTTGGVIVAGLLAPALVYGWHGNIALLEGWFRTVTGSTSGNLLGADNVSLAAMWAKWLGIGTPATVLALITIVGVLSMVVLLWRRRTGVASPDYLEYALLMLLMPLLSPQGWDYVLLLGTPAVACLLDRLARLGRPWQTVSVAALAVMGLTIFDLMGRTLYGQLMGLSVVSVAALGVTVALANLRWKRLA